MDIPKEIIEKELDDFYDILVEAFGWTTSEYHFLRSQLGIKFDILRDKLFEVKK